VRTRNRRYPCRTDPDISANADEYTPYAEYARQCGYAIQRLRIQRCSDAARVVRHRRDEPVVAALVGIIADRDSYQGLRSGNVNPLLYSLYRGDPTRFFHDINGRQATNNNGFYPTTKGYDLATGIGAPIMKALIVTTH